MIHVAVTGISGRMGKAIARIVSQTDGLSLTAGIARRGSAPIGQDASGVTISDDLSSAIDQLGVRVVIDFTSPALTREVVRICAERGVGLVVGTTGLSADDRAELSRHAQRVPIVFAPNMSIGVNVMFRAAAQLAQVLEGFDVEIVEAHHRLKKDAPSGTALKLAEEIAAARGQNASAFRTTRDGQIGERPRAEIGIQTVRGGDVVGEHTVFFLGDGERVELTHRASSRDQFAKGAARAALWVAGRAAGLYDMQDVLGLRGGPRP